MSSDSFRVQAKFGITNNILTIEQNTMKKLTVLTVVLAAFSFASCKKERTCVCTTNVGTEVSTSERATKKKAKSHCEAKSTTSGGLTTTCKIQG